MLALLDQRFLCRTYSDDDDAIVTQQNENNQINDERND